jgi:phosphatidylinositol-3-phosphatase
MSGKGLTWKAYAEDMGKDPKRDGTTQTKLGPACGHPELGGVDYTDDTEPANDSYATRHNGFMYFESVIGNQRYCDAHVQTISRLVPDLGSASTTPDLSFVTPNTCNDAHDIPKCQNGEKGGLGKADEWLEEWVPRITDSPAYLEGGMVVITFDESGEDSDASGCCGEVESSGLDDPSHPNVNQPGLYGAGGGKIGAVVLSPFVKPGTHSKAPYTTTRCCARSRTPSASAISATPSSLRSTRSGPMSSPPFARPRTNDRRSSRWRTSSVLTIRIQS